MVITQVSASPRSSHAFLSGFLPILDECSCSSSRLVHEPCARRSCERRYSSREEPLADTATVHVCVNSAQSDNGRVVVALFKSADGFPREKEKAAYTASAPIEADSASVRVAGVVEGDYAIFAFHDADGNGTLNTNWAGMPKEGIALSNWTGGRPTFDDSTIEVRSDTTIDLSFYYR
jgi:uncharacterized protein (DUF2141 family)